MKHPKTRVLVSPFGFGSDDFEDSNQVYGDGGDVDDGGWWPEVSDACDCERNPSGHHVYNALAEPERCVYCKRVT